MQRGEAREGGVYGDTRGNRSAAQDFKSLHISPPPSSTPLHPHLEALKRAIRLLPVYYRYQCMLYIPCPSVRDASSRRAIVCRDLAIAATAHEKQRASDEIDELLEVLGWGLGRTQTRTCMLTQTRMHTHSHARTPSGVLLAALSPTRVRLLYMTTYFYKIKTLRCYIV